MRVGIDLGGTNIAIGLFSEEGTTVDKISIKTHAERGHNVVINHIIEQIKKMLYLNEFEIKDLNLIGIGVPGLVDYSKGIVHQCVNICWKNVPLSQIIIEGLNRDKCNNKSIKVLLDNDANVAALGEYLFGTMKNSKNSLLLTLGTGIGGGLILDGKLHRGKGAAGEVGHMIIGENFYNCSCGNNGCFETFASATAIVKFTEKLIKYYGNKSIILDYVNGDFSKIDAKAVFEGARLNDRIALLSIDRFTKYLAIGINNLINILDLEAISIGGGVSAGEDIFMDKLLYEVSKKRLYKSMRAYKIEIACLGNDAGIVGASFLDKA